MAEEQQQEQVITFRGKQYFAKDLSEESLRYVEHILDVEKKLYATGLRLEQQQLSHNYFSELLGRELEPTDVE